MKVTLTLLLILMFLPATGAQDQMPGYLAKDGVDQTAVQASLVQLIASPQTYDGKKVRIIGFLRLEFEGDALYLHREDYEHGITENALWIDTPREMTKAQREAVNTQYAICEGIFKASGHGHMGMFSGELADVSRIHAWPIKRPS